MWIDGEVVEVHILGREVVFPKFVPRGFVMRTTNQWRRREPGIPSRYN
jgi:hypothetical protein